MFFLKNSGDITSSLYDVEAVRKVFKPKSYPILLPIRDKTIGLSTLHTTNKQISPNESLLIVTVFISPSIF